MLKPRAYGSYYENIEDFVLSLTKLEAHDYDQDYAEGFQRIKFYPQLLAHHAPPRIEEEGERRPRTVPFEYESKLAERILSKNRPQILVLIGGLGSGKSTSWVYLIKYLAKKARRSFRSGQCKCSDCKRYPVLVDCIDISESATPEMTSNAVLKRVRLRLYEQLLTEWLAEGPVKLSDVHAIDKGFLVLRRLLIANDLMREYAEETDFDVDLRSPDVQLDKPLFSYPPSLRLIRALHEQYEEAVVGDIQTRLQAVVKSREQSIKFMVMLMRFYAERCQGKSPLSLLIVDNLDQLPNQHITCLVNELFDIALKSPKVPIIVPLRPSSISVRGFKGKPDYRYHYGPSNFEMILKRIERRLLMKSLAELRESFGQQLASVFHSRPDSDSEIYVLLLIAYLYARILLAGLESEQEGLTDHRIRLHTDHAFLEKLIIPEGVFLQISRTLAALVGTCSRYAIEEMQRYFINSYHDVGFFLATVRRLNRGEVTVGIRRALPRLIDTIISNEGGPDLPERRVNLFRPIRSTSNHDWPTMVPLRILQYLVVNKRATVRVVLSRLRSYGVPAAVGVEYLNALHEKERILVWFSDNRNLQRSKEALEHYVVISEHGLAYYADLIGDFEYCWYCAAEIASRTYEKPRLSFDAKLAEYVTMVGRLGETEVKQIAFRRCAARTLTEGEEAEEIREMFVLTVLYKGLFRILESVDIALRRGGLSVEYASILESRLREVAGLALRWQERYELIWGSRGYRAQYADDIRLTLQPLQRLLEAHILKEATEAQLASVESSWTSTAIAANESTAPGSDLKEAFGREVGVALRGGSSFLRRLRQERPGSPGPEGPVIGSLRRFFSQRSLLRTRLSLTIPTYSEVADALKGLHRTAELCLEQFELREGVPTTLRVWFEREVDANTTLLKSLEANQYTIPGLTANLLEHGELSEMTERKRKCNEVLDCFLRTAERLDAPAVDHLRYRWR